MTFACVVSVWKDGSPGPDRAVPDLTVPLDILVAPGAVPTFASLVPDVLSSYGLTSARLVRFVHGSEVVADYWNQKVPV